jgi:hypothetical protein
MILTRSQRILLETIDKYNGEWNWYKLGRLCLSHLDNPADFTLKPFLDAGYVEERSYEGEPLPRLHITPAGKAALRLSPASKAVASH